MTHFDIISIHDKMYHKYHERRRNTLTSEQLNDHRTIWQADVKKAKVSGLA